MTPSGEFKTNMRAHQWDLTNGSTYSKYYKLVLQKHQFKNR